MSKKHKKSVVAPKTTELETERTNGELEEICWEDLAKLAWGGSRSSRDVKPKA